MFTTLETFDTQFSADSVEWCPIDGFHDIFVCGTYQLSTENKHNVPDKKEDKDEIIKMTKDDESKEDKKGVYSKVVTSSNTVNLKPQVRLGIIFLFQVLASGKLKLLQQLQLSGVLDIKWSHVKCQGCILLGVVNSVGFLQIYKLSTENELKIELLIQVKIRDIEGELLGLSLDWNCGNIPSDCSVDEVKIAVSDSTGFVSIFRLVNHAIHCDGALKAHEFQAWITAFNCWDTNVIYSGGDDCKMRRFDIREGLKSTGCNRRHGAGVTSLHCNSSKEFCLASGSYDETLRLWDTRNFNRPISETLLGGGIWRLKWDPFDTTCQRYLLAACMHAGFRLVDCKIHENPLVIEEYNEHDSIAYGCDWSFLTSEKVSRILHLDCRQKTTLVATCSFYDNTLKLSSVHLNE